MTIDVIKSPKSGSINDGSIITNVNKFGDYDKISPDINKQLNINNIENNYTDRFSVNSDLSLYNAEFLARNNENVPITIRAKAAQSGNLFEVYDGAGDLTLHIDPSGDLFIDDTMWDDLRIIPSTFDFPGVNDPSITTWTPGGGGVTFRVWEFEQSDQGFFTCQLPHTYKPNSDISAHVHWTPKDRGVAESGKTVHWALDYSIASINSVFPSSVTVNMQDYCDGINHKHCISSGVTISGSGINISAMLIGRVYRKNTDSWVSTSAGQLPCLLELDIHYQVNSLGSREERSK